MCPRRWSLAAACCLLVAQAGCRLQQSTETTVRPVAQAKSDPVPEAPPRNYAFVTFEPETTPEPAKTEAATPEVALQRSVLMQELPRVTTPEPPTLATETQIRHQIHPAPLPPRPEGDGKEVAVAATPAPALISGVYVPLTGNRAPTPAALPVQPAPAGSDFTTSAYVWKAPEEPILAAPPKQTTTAPPLLSTPPAPVPAGNATRTLLNSPNVALNYRVGRMGPSGVGKVEVWISGDQGDTWQRLCEDVDRCTPSEIQLPGEGLWGVRLVALNGNGFGGTAPKRGDQPNFSVEVDTSNPRVTLGAVEPTEGPMLDIHWTAQDSHLGAAPVALYYRVEPDRPWQRIADKLPNTGCHRWQFPREHTQFYIRVQVCDEAGNCATSESPTAVAVDTTVPQLIVVGVSGAKR